MGKNYRFKLSDMIPNAWFYKLRDMGKSRKQTSTTTTSTSQSRKKKQSSSTPTSSTKPSSKPKQSHQYYNPRKSYYFTRDLNLNTSPPNNKKVLPSNFHEPPRKSTKQNFHEPPRKSNKQRAKRRTSKTSNSPKHSYSSTPLELEFHDPEFRTDSVLLPTDQSLGLFDEMVSLPNNYSSCVCRVVLNDDIIIDVDNNSIARKDDKLEGGYDDSFSQHVLPPIVTKPRAKFNDLLGDDAKNNNNKKATKPRSRMVTHKDQQHNIKGESGFTAVADMDFGLGLMTLDPSNDSRCITSSNVVNVCKSDRRESESIKGSLKIKIVKEDNASIKEVRNSPSAGGGGGRRLRLRINSPRIRSRKSVSSVAGGRRILSDSFAFVKSSFNPQRDFRESMVEMIVQNNIRSSKDLEDLLACYLSLNSDEYHDLIIKVFKQIWFNLTDNQ